MQPSFEIDPYAAIRSAMSPEHAHLGSDEIAIVLGRMPAAVVLHQVLTSPEIRQAAVASLLGHNGRRSVRVNGVDVSVPAYLRMVARLCREVAEQGESYENGVPLPMPGEANLPMDKQQVGKLGIGSFTRITDTRAIPFRSICSLAVSMRITTSGGSVTHGVRDPDGTGVMISPCHVLTAAHVLSSVDDSGSAKLFLEAESVRVALARDESTLPFGQVNAKSWKVHPGWKPEKNEKKFDYALITLEKPLPGACFWGSPKCSDGTVLDALPDALAAALIGRDILTAGYPVSKRNQMWCATGTLSSGSVDQDTALQKVDQTKWAKATPLIFITADAERGQSGSPVWVTDNGRRHLIGILVDAAPKLNIAVAVNDSVIRQLQSWMKSSECDPSESLVNEPELPGESYPSRLWTPGVTFEEETPPPPGVPAFEHFFQPMKADATGSAWTADGGDKKLEPLNPGFIDDKDNLVTGALHDRLADLLTGNADFSRYLTKKSIRSRQGHSDDKIHVALVDLTGKKMTQPEFAGWASTVPVNAGSAIKIAVLYAAFQLKADVEHLARTEGIRKFRELADLADKRWKSARIAVRPNLLEIFDADHDPPDLAFAADVKDAIDHIALHEANVAASTLIHKIGFPYIASAIWHSGLRHPARGGIWLMWNFDENHPEQWDGAPEPPPRPLFPHTATALSMATFYTLMAQGRLPNPASSGEMKGRLQESWYRDVLPHAAISAKVGLDNKCLTWKVDDKGKNKCDTWEVLAAHEGDYIENGNLRYAVAIMTKGINEGVIVLRNLIVAIDDLIRKNNP